jgi:hypothetical protein
MLFLDANAILYYLHDVKPYSQIVENITSEEDELFTSIRVLDETIFTIVRTKAWIKLGIRRIEKLREYIQKHGYEFFEEDIDKLYKFLKEANIAVVEDKATPQELIEVAKRFHLLPADALIALTCQHYGIGTILTFDEDFKRVPWLKVIP